MSRARVLPQLLLGWVPVWGLYTLLIASQHRSVDAASAAVIGALALVPAALLGLLVHRLARRFPWPHPFRASFAVVHLVAAPGYALAWVLLASALNNVHGSGFVIGAGPGIVPFMALGVWLYVMVAGVSYSAEAAARAARAEAAAARTQLAALRAQLHPHFLFNALHTVVQLIPLHPERAAEAAELVAGLLRTTIEEDRDVVSLADEWAFVARYLEVERIRFGDRLQVHSDIGHDLLDARVPSFALQTLVENAVRHGAAPRVEPTEISVRATATAGTLTIRVHDTGAGAPAIAASGPGTGLARLRERLAVLYGDASRLHLESDPSGGFAATLVIPRASNGRTPGGA